MASVQQQYQDILEPVVGEPIVRALFFQSSYARSMATVVLRLGQRAAGSGGLDAQIGQGNFVVVTATRVVLLRGLQAPYESIGEWSRSSVTGSAVRKHLTSTRRSAWTDQLHTSEQWMLRTTLQTPDGPITFDIDEERGGRPMLKALGVALPPLKKATWWRSQPFD